MTVDASAAAVGSLLLLLLMTLAAFTASCLRDMPAASRSERCQPECRTPMIDPEYWSHYRWRCGECGTDWRIHVDCSRSRKDYRQWVRTR